MKTVATKYGGSHKIHLYRIDTEAFSDSLQTATDSGVLAVVF